MFVSSLQLSDLCGLFRLIHVCVVIGRMLWQSGLGRVVRKGMVASLLLAIPLIIYHQTKCRVAGKDLHYTDGWKTSLQTH